MILYKIADKVVFNILKRISVGYLEITLITGELLKFGDHNDKLRADLKIKSPILNYNLIKGGSVGLAECYMRNEFETSNLSNLIELAARNINIVHKFAGILDLKFLNFIKNKFVKNTKNRSKENIAKQ
jgi:cyclopropane-fatty-acyl-phospholipid synthase